jgi:predicted amidophosphoribosyltransferase
MSLLVDSSIAVVHPTFLNGASCLAVDHFARFAAGGMTEMGQLVTTAKNAQATVPSRLEAAKTLWQLVADAVDCIPQNHPARRARAIVHAPLSTSNGFALNAIACAVSEVLHIQVHSNCLVKMGAGPKMKAAPPAIKASIVGTLAAHDVPDGPLLVIDDVVETGATLAAAAQALRAAGAGELEFLVGVVLD